MKKLILELFWIPASIWSLCLKNFSHKKILDEEKKIRKRRHSNTTKMDILSELDQRGLLRIVLKIYAWTIPRIVSF